MKYLVEEKALCRAGMCVIPTVCALSSLSLEMNSRGSDGWWAGGGQGVCVCVCGFRGWAVGTGGGGFTGDGK